MKIINDYQGDIIQPSKEDSAFVFKPYICQQVLKADNGLPWIGFVFLCEVDGEIKMSTKEAKNPRWVTIKELKQIIEDEAKNIFPLQLPVLKYFVENIRE